MENQELQPEEEEAEEDNDDFAVFSAEHVCSFSFNCHVISINEIIRFCPMIGMSVFYLVLSELSNLTQRSIY